MAKFYDFNVKIKLDLSLKCIFSIKKLMPLHRLLLCILIASFFVQKSEGQHTFLVKGSIQDFSTSASLSDVNIFVEELNRGTSTNKDGDFQLQLPSGTYTLLITYLGYEQYSEKIEVNQNLSLNFKLLASTESLDEVIIKQDFQQKTKRQLTMSVNKLDAQTIKKIPTVLGENDVIKSLKLLPGVTGAGEASGGLHVRGGAADQNLILLDHAMMFNESHLFGFFSIFNPDAVANIQLYKGGIPSNFGGRASSVLDISQKTGDLTTVKVNGGIGLVSSKLTVEGPIEKNKSSFLVSGRTSYAHLFLKLIDNPNSAFFYDLNSKLNFIIDEKNTLSLSGYFGRDVFKINDSFKNIYGNALANIQWKHHFSTKLNSELSLIFSNYQFGLTIDFIGFNWDSGIKNFNLKYNLQHQLSENTSLAYGIQAIYYNFNPGYIEPSREDSGIERDQLTKKYAFENSAYLQVNQELGDFTLGYGLRLNQFLRMGQDEINLYENNQPVIFNKEFQIYESAEIQETYSESKSKVSKSFINLEPRASISYSLNDKELIKANYQRINQYIHLLSNSNTPTPLDIWAPSGRYIRPQQGNQVSFGYANSLIKKAYGLETEVYYKTINNRIDYIDGAELIANKAIERVILNGESRAYGLEFLFRKNKGKFTGWLAYTLSRSEQRTPGRTPLENGINNGNWYNTAWDKTHDISLVGNYELSKKWSFNASFVYQTGRPATYPVSVYQYNSFEIPNYGSRNTNRLPSFHHLDISATLTPEKNNNRNWKSEWIFSIYNVYNRRNAASISFQNNKDTDFQNEAVRLSIFGIIPSVAYNFKF